MNSGLIAVTLACPSASLRSHQAYFQLLNRVRKRHFALTATLGLQQRDYVLCEAWLKLICVSASALILIRFMVGGMT